MYSNGSNTAQKLESLEKKVGNLQETVSDIQPIRIAATKTVSKGPYISNSVNDTEPLESMVYRQPVAKKVTRALTAEESRADAAATQAVSIMEKYMDNIKVTSDQRQDAFDIIHNAILAGMPVPSRDDVMSAIEARSASQVPVGFVATKKVARSQMNQPYNSGENQSYMPQQPVRKVPSRPMNQPYNSGENQSYMPQQPVRKVPSRPMNQPYNSGENQSYMPQQAQPRIAPLISTYQPPPESSSKDLQSALSLFNKIQSTINNTLFGPLNNLLSSVGEPTISIKAATKKPATVRLKRGGGKAVTKKAVKKPATKTVVTKKTTTSISPLAEITATSNDITSQVSSLQRGLQTISKYLPCKPCEPCESSETSGPTEGGSRVKKSEKTRRNRRS